jgi:hypothetical protein
VARLPSDDALGNSSRSRAVALAEHLASRRRAVALRVAGRGRSHLEEGSYAHVRSR